MPISQPGVVNCVGRCILGGYLCGLCEGACLVDSDCEDDLVCVSRSSGFAAVEGCTGAGGDGDMYGMNICVSSASTSTSPSISLMTSSGPSASLSPSISFQPSFLPSSSPHKYYATETPHGVSEKTVEAEVGVLNTN